MIRDIFILILSVGYAAFVLAVLGVGVVAYIWLFGRR